MEKTILTRLLQEISKPSQYLGNEVNSVHKDFHKQKLRVCLVFPDLYEMGMSHMGLKILYDILNNIEGVVAERCFAPAQDFEAKLRENHLPLFSLESKTSLSEFDIVGISLPYELTFTNTLNILEMGQIPLWQKDRKAHHPLILGGGTGAYNPEPIADFFDAIAIGDAEELMYELVDKVIAWKLKNNVDQLKDFSGDVSCREDLLTELKNIEGIYIPSFFEPEYKADGTLAQVKALKEGYTGVKKRVVADLNAQPYPTKLILPNIRLIHDRIGIEIRRGCTRMCRFCQAGYIERPTRQRSPEKVLEIARESYAQTGMDEISLLSLSAGDYQTIVPTLKALNKEYAGKNVSISVPATRTETLTPELIEQVKKVRKTGFTIAPEAGTERMRRVINKGNKVENLMQACENAFSAGYQLIKFYYLCGLPFEHDEDVLGIASEAGLALQVGLKYSRKVEINVSVSSFVPKPFTPFQWDKQMTIAETRRKHDLIKFSLGDKRLRFKCHVPEMSFLEGLFARGDRRLSKVLYQAFLNGCRFDGWEESFRFDLWKKTFEETGVDLDFYLHREKAQDEILPWDHLFVQMRKEWLWLEREAARKEAYVADCSLEKCAQFCGACDFKTVKNKVYVVDDEVLAAKKGNREWYGRFGENSPSPQAEVVESSSVNPKTLADRVKLRAVYSKTGMAALFGHLELMEHLKRAILRVGVPVTYSQGFHPQMKLAMGYALPLGLESDEETFDLVLSQDVDLEKFQTLLNASLPQGLQILKCERVDLKAPSLYSQTQAVDYRAEFSNEILEKMATLKQNLELWQSGKDLVVTRVKGEGRDKKVKQYPLKDWLKLGANPLPEKQIFEFTTLCHESGSITPSEVLQTLAELSPKEMSQVRLKKMGVHYAA